MAISREQPLRPYVQALGDALDSGDIVSSNAVQAFDTVADMQAATDLQAGMTCHTNGFHAAGDGGAAYYTIGTTGIANGMDVLACADSLIAMLIVMEPYVTPEMFGAYGDGTHDDTAALQFCIKSGNTAILEHTYLITQALNFNNITDFTMCGGTITRPVDQTFNTVYGSDCRNITIENVVFEGNGNNRDMTYTWKDNIQACIILASRSKDIRVEKCRISNFNYGVFICGSDVEHQSTSYENTALNGVICDCTFHNCKSAIDTYGKGIIIDHNVLYDITGAAIQIEPNNIWGGADNPLDDPEYYDSAVGCVVSNNLIISVDLIAIVVGNANSYGTSILNNTIIDYGQGIEQSLSRALVIDGNHLLYQRPQTPNNTTKPWGWISAIEVGRRATVTNNYLWKADVGINIVAGSIVSGNTIESPRISAITVYMNSSAMDETIIISHNRIIGHVRNTALWWASRAIAIGAVRNIFIDNNVVDSDTQPLYVLSDNTASVSRLISNVAETDTIPAPSGFSVYSN